MSKVKHANPTADFKYVFKRYEAKYIINKEQKDALMKAFENIMLVDSYGKTKICNIYFDTPDFAIIRHSNEKPLYKEKLRLRCYGIPTMDSTAFVEIKKKFDGIVYKRRVSMTLAQAVDYMENGKEPPEKNQITREIDYFMRYYKDIGPKMYLSYDRVAMYCVEDPNLRITFDDNITWRTYDLDLSHGSYGEKLFDDDIYVMEVKIPNAMPLWLIKIFDEVGIRRGSLSKYGSCYKILFNREREDALKRASVGEPFYVRQIAQ